MGNLCQNNKEKAIKDIIELSIAGPKHLTESDIQEIMMNSQFQENELLKLYKKFQELDEGPSGILTNQQLLNLDEFKYTPFRKRLIYSLQLKSDEQWRDLQNMQNNDVKLEDLGKILKEEEEPKNDKEEKKDSDDDDEEGEDKSTDGEKKGKKKEEEEVPEEDGNLDVIADTDEFIQSMGKASYIDFAEFAKIMSLFNPRTGIDEKIQFYFRIFDVNEDKKIDKEDLNKIMKMLFGSKLNSTEMDTLADKIFNEVIQSSEKDFLDQDDVQKILWSTNIEHKCSMHFFQS